MKKLVLGRALEEGFALCNFCGEDDVPCVKGSIDVTVGYRSPITTMERVFKGESKFVFPIFDKPYHKVTDYELKEVVQSWEDKTNTESCDICKDCIRQLAKLIK